MSDLKSLPIDGLANLKHTCLESIKRHKDTIKAVDEELTARYQDDCITMYQMQHKEHGTIKMDLGNGYLIKSDIGKKVKWDNAGLASIAATLTMDEVHHFFNIDFKMSEKIYNALPEGGFKDRVDKARTTYFNPMKLDIVLPETE